MHQVAKMKPGTRYALLSFFYGEVGAALRRQVAATKGEDIPPGDRRITVPPKLNLKWKNPPIAWAAAKAQFAIQFGERFKLAN